MDAIEFISSKLKDTKNNAEFFNSMINLLIKMNDLSKDLLAKIKSLYEQKVFKIRTTVKIQKF